MKKIITTESGSPVECESSTITVGKNGPVLLQDSYLIEKLAHLNRQTTMPRAMHTKGAGAYGYFEVTNDLSRYTCADFLSCVGKKTDIYARFSQALGKRGSSDTVRNIRGFAIKFYTCEGNYDILSITLPAFFLSDIKKFPDFVHSQEGNSRNNLIDPNAVWDFWSLSPESIHAITLLFTDRGTPASYTQMNTYGPHAFLWYNKQGERFLVKYHIKSKRGIKNFTNQEAIKIAGENPDYLMQDIDETIQRGNTPEYQFFVQIMPEKEAYSHEYNPYNVTQIWPKKDYPLIELGKLVLNRTPNNYFTEVEESAFAVSNFVPGINASNDKFLQGRLFVYPDAQNYRIGINKNQIPVNMPKNQVFNFERDGDMNVSENGGSGPNYYPNSFKTIEPFYCRCKIPSEELCSETGCFQDEIMPTFVQTGNFYRSVLSKLDREHLIDNLVDSLSGAMKKIQYRQTALFYLCDKDYGMNIAYRLKLDSNKVIHLASMSQEERIEITANW